MYEFVQLFFSDVLNHPDLIEVGIIGFSQDRRSVFVLVGLLLDHHECFSGHVVDDLVVITRPQVYFFNCG